MHTIDATYEGLAPMMHDRFFNAEETDRGRAKKRAAGTWKEELPLKPTPTARVCFCRPTTFA